MNNKMTGAEIRQSFIDFFISKGHTFVRSSSVVPGGDQTLLFTNAGMVQFKDVFLGTDQRPYSRATNSQKCMRVAGKHNDLDDVGRDDSHHTFFEMLGNWSFGDYYKPEAIAWAWELLTQVWGLDKSVLWTTCFRDDKGDIPTDEEAAAEWRKQPGIDPTHVLYFGRKENFWEMADTGPCGPCSEIHIDLGPEFCDKKNDPGHVCRVNGDCKRFLELWNLVFIQYNRLNPSQLEPLPRRHVDTGMGLERVVGVIQKVYSTYRTDLLLPLMQKVQEMTGHSDFERDAEITPYRVIADHARSAAFLIADGVVPGNTGRNYVCRMIIRRAARFGSKIGLNEPFLARVAAVVINNYSEAYPELEKNRQTILDNLTREEERFRRTVEGGLIYLEELRADLQANGKIILGGSQAFYLYATHGLPLELTRDILREQGLDVDVEGFQAAMDEHRIASRAGNAFGAQGGEDAEFYRNLLDDLVNAGNLPATGVLYDPYSRTEVQGNLLAIIKDGESISEALTGDEIAIILPETCFYLESGGQVSDEGLILSAMTDDWQIKVEQMRRPAPGVVLHMGKVVKGSPKVGDALVARVDSKRRSDIQRNHTATHLLHSQLHAILGEHARQAGSLVAPDRLRFDFTHPEGLTSDQLEKIEAGVNQAILAGYGLNFVTKSLSQAIAEGAMALFGEKYGEVVRTISIGDAENPYSYELCGGTHVDNTGDIGLFLIISEGSAAAGVRRIEAVTGRAAFELVQKRFRFLKQTASLLSTALEDVPAKLGSVLTELEDTRKQVAHLRQGLVAVEFERMVNNVPTVEGIPVLAAVLANADADSLRAMADSFRQKYPSGVVVLGSVKDGRPVIIAAVTEDLVKRGINAGELVKMVAQQVGGSGGGKPTLAQAGGKDPAALPSAIQAVPVFVKKHLQ